MSKKKNASTPKPAKPDATPRARKPWSTKRLSSAERISKMLDKLGELVAKANAPSPLADHLHAARVHVGSFDVALRTLGEWKPAGRAGKPSVGAVVRVKDESRTAATFVTIEPATYQGAKVVAEDGSSWIVECADGVKRLLQKKYAQLV